MKTAQTMRTASRLAIATLTSVLFSPVAMAGSQLEDILNSCTDINCKAMSIRGVSQFKEPFVVQLFAEQGECLRIEVVKQTVDLEMTLVSPDIQELIYTDDDSAGDLRPVVVVDPVLYGGWYTLLVSEFDASLQKGKFQVKYGRYNSGNPNCPAATQAIGADSGSDLAKPTGLVPHATDEAEF